MTRPARLRVAESPVLVGAAILWLLLFAAVAVGGYGRMVNDARTDVGEWGER